MTGASAACYDRGEKIKKVGDVLMVTPLRIRLRFSCRCALCRALVRVRAGGKAYYAGKTVRMVVGSGTGGGYDIFSRMIAPYLAKELGTTVIVENQPGAGGLVALNRLYVAPPDGLQISLSNGSGGGVRATPR